MDLTVKDFSDGNETSNLTVSDDVFVAKFNEPLIHQVVVSYLSGARQGSRAQKSRNEVRGGGAKPWRQKGTGRARSGTRSSPIWRSGGVTFAAKPKNHALKVNRKMFQAAMKSIVSELVRCERFIVVKSINVDSPKTKNMASLLAKQDLKNVLIVAEEIDENLYLSTRNIPNVEVIEIDCIDPVALISYEKILISETAVKKLEQRFK